MFFQIFPNTFKKPPCKPRLQPDRRLCHPHAAGKLVKIPVSGVIPFRKQAFDDFRLFDLSVHKLCAGRLSLEVAGLLEALVGFLSSFVPSDYLIRGWTAYRKPFHSKLNLFLRSAFKRSLSSFIYLTKAYFPYLLIFISKEAVVPANSLPY